MLRGERMFTEEVVRTCSCGAIVRVEATVTGAEGQAVVVVPVEPNWNRCGEGERKGEGIDPGSEKGLS